MKKGKEVVIRVNDVDTFNTYLDPNFNKLVVINAFDAFWGPVEILENFVRRVLDDETVAAKLTFIAVNKDLNLELWGKHEFTSKPSYFIFHKGNYLDLVEGIDLPKLMEKIDKHIIIV